VYKQFIGLGKLGSVLMLVAALASAVVQAEGHGPVFALATPTLGKGHWSSDTGLMSVDTDAGSAFMARQMIGYGINADLQAILSVPLDHSGDKLMGVANSRLGAMMGAGQDVEASLLWRFDREAPAVGTRRESTLIFSTSAPTETRRAGTEVGPSAHIGAVTGFASRETYWWLGGGYQYYFEDGQDQLGDLTYLSAAFAWRPPVFQQDYPKPDWRIFIEAVAEHSGHNTINGVDNPDSGGAKLLAGPSVLGLFGPWGVSAGIMFPVVQDLNGDQDAFEERYRAKAVLTYWF
jgi:hypothetical protein